MQSIRRNFTYARITAILTLVLFMAVGYVSCIKDNCTTIVCQNDGLCVEGVCTCAPGYFGVSCEQAWSTRFLGTWQVRDTIIKRAGIVSSYSIHISNADNSKPYTFVADNFAGFADSMAAARQTHINFAFNDKVLDSTTTIHTATGKFDTLTNTFTAYYTIKIGDSTFNHFIRASR